MHRRLISVGAVVAGFLVTAVTSTVVDSILHATGVYPPVPQRMSEGLFVLAFAYRAAFTVAGGYVAARLAPDLPMRHAWVLAGIGVVAGLAGIGAWRAMGGEAIGPLWYALSMPAMAIPCVWLGGKLAVRQRLSVQEA